MTVHTSTAAAVLSRRALLLNGVAMAALAAISPVTAAAIRKGTTREKETKMKAATTQLDTTRVVYRWNRIASRLRRRAG